MNANINEINLICAQNSCESFNSIIEYNDSSSNALTYVNEKLDTFETKINGEYNETNFKFNDKSIQLLKNTFHNRINNNNKFNTVLNNDNSGEEKNF
jgi:regulator of sigma D